MTEHERAEDVHDHKRTDGGPDSVVAPFPPERPADDTRPVTQREQEARATAAALAGEHGTDGPPQYVDAPEPRGHNAGDYEIPDESADGAKATRDRQGAAGQKTADKDKADKDKAAEKDKEDWRDKGSAASR